MEHSRVRDPPLRETVHASLGHPRALAPAPERVAPGTNDLAAKTVEASGVCGHGVVREIAAYHVLDPLSLHGHGQMATPMEILADPFQLRAHYG